MPALWIPKRLVEADLLNLAARDPAAFVAYGEEHYHKKIEDAAKEVQRSHCKVVMLTGPSASGKTTTAHKLAGQLMQQGVHAVVVSLDNFYRNFEDYPRMPDGSVDYENITALDIDAIHKSLGELIEAGEADFPEFDFETERRKETVNRVELLGGVVVVEGIHALNPILTDELPHGSTYHVYAGLREEYSYNGQRFLPTKDLRLARRMVRDNMFRGHSLAKTLGMWAHVCEGEDMYIKAYKPYADFLLDTSFSCEPGVLAPFVLPLAAEMPGVPQMDALGDRFARFTPIPAGLVPQGSMLREFIGNAGLAE